MHVNYTHHTIGKCILCGDSTCMLGLRSDWRQKWCEETYGTQGREFRCEALENSKENSGVRLGGTQSISESGQGRDPVKVVAWHGICSLVWLTVVVATGGEKEEFSLGE